jgi:hypothetical protein
VIVNGKECAARGLPDWQLTPIARYADSPYFAVVTLSGQLDERMEPPPGTCGVVSFHPAFQDTLLGLRLVQGDMWWNYHIRADLPRFGNQYLLGPGEQRPDLGRAAPACAVLTTIAASKFDGYVICDFGSTPKFFTEENNHQSAGRFFVRGDLYYHYYRRGPERLERVDEAGMGPRLYRSFEVQHLPELSEAVSAQTELQERANPALYHAVVNTMRYAAFFRYCRERDPDMWQEFLKSLDRIPEARYRAPTPVLVTRRQTGD